MKIRTPWRGVIPAGFVVAIMLLAPPHGVPGAAAGGWGEGGHHERGAFCSATARAAGVACGHEKLDDYWIAVGNCDNLADRQERRSCLMDAAAALGEGQDECRDQAEARRDVCDLLGEAPYAPEFDPADFVDPLAVGGAVAPNPYLPLVPGTEWVYESEDETNTVRVTDEVKEILGVPCIVVRDTVEADGAVIEDTDDWLCQDRSGNVWYFGELSRSFEDGELVDLGGSWKAGRDGAQPGVLMPAAPRVGDLYRQEFFLGDAEDLAEVISTTGSADVPAASCSGDCVITREFTPLEPDIEADKFYAPGVGMILEVEDGARTELVDFSAP